MSEIKILLLCGSRFAIPSMRDLVFFQRLAAVVIPSYCKDVVQEVQQLLNTSGIPVIQVTKENNEAELKKAIKKYEITLAFIMTYPYKIPSAVYDLPEKGFFNFHPGPLPEYRGADPIFHQIKNQEQQAGVTVHKLDEGIDTGPVVVKEMLKLETTDTYGILTNKLSELAAKLSGLLLKMAGFGISIPSKPQDQSKAGYFKRQSSNDVTIQWQTMDAGAVIALINACNPWNKGAVTSINNKIIRLLGAEKIPEKNTDQASPGTVLSVQPDTITVAVLNGEVLSVSYVYIDEGFLRAGSLTHAAVVPGSQFISL